MPVNRPSANEAPLLVMEGIDKRFPGVHALKKVHLTLSAGEVLALVGENGAGKSTLIKVLGGASLPDRGTLRIHGVDPGIANPVDAQRAGISVIYQEFNLIPGLTARENIFLGRERSRFGFIARKEESRQALELFGRIGVSVDPETPCRELSVAQQQAVEIAKALSQEAKIIVMDEPSATLTPQEVNHLFSIVRELKTQGIGVIYISHRLEEIFVLADRVMVMRDGEGIATAVTGDLPRERLIELMVGRRLENEFPHRISHVKAPRLRVRNLCRGRKVRNVSFDIRAGEILALTGLVGAGRTETARLLFGADQAESGTIELDGVPLRLRHPRDAIRRGICLLSEDRKLEGLVLGLSVRENFGLPNMSRFARMGIVHRGKESGACAGYIQLLSIKVPHAEQAVRNLSGGNQQKVVLAKWLQRNAEVLLFDEPTRGIDVGAKYEIYLLLNELARQGKAILMISSELPEVLGMADRILVMHEGRIRGEITDVRNSTQEQILNLAVG